MYKEISMQLIIDSGNTNWKIAIFDQDELISIKRFDTLCSTDLTEIFNNNSLEKGIISSVSDLPEFIISQLKDNISLIELSYDTKLPITIDYKTPQTLGKDRIAGVVGAKSLFPDENILVIDAGTCITYDILDAKGNYLGGSISPGLQMRFKALNNFTHKLPLIQCREFDELTGKSTEESILSGVLQGINYEIDGFIEAYRKQFSTLKIILTGGDALYFEKTLKNGIFVSSNIVLIGLKEILKYNA